METDIVIWIVAGLLMVLGLIGSVAPVLPGPPLSFAGILLLQLTGKADFGTTLLIVLFIGVLIVSVVDYMIPIWGAARFGGTSNGLWGAAIGMLIGFFVLPGIGLIVGTVLGAFIGEMSRHNADPMLAAKAALGALVGFLLSTALKLIVCIIMAVYFTKEMIASFAA